MAKPGDSLLVRGIRWRLGSSIMAVVVSAIAVGAAVLGPLYLRTAGDSVLRDALGSATTATKGVTLLAPPGQVPEAEAMSSAEQTIEDAGGPQRWYGAAITTVTAGVGLAAPDRSPLFSALFSRSGICSVLHFRQGRCAQGPAEVAVSDRTAAELGVSVGSTIDAGVKGRTAPLVLRVSGVYAVPDLALPYWWGDGPGYFPFGTTTGPNHTPQVDPLVTSAATAVSVPAGDAPAVIGQVPLQSGRVDLGNAASLERSLVAATGDVAASGISATSGLPAVLAGAAHERHTMSTIVAVAAIQLVVLSIWVLAGLLLRAADSRREEIRVARLRGFTVRGLLWTIAAEPCLLCAAGVALGLVGGWAAVTAARDVSLNARAQLALDGWTVLAFAVSVIAIAAAVSLGVRRSLRSSSLSGLPGRYGFRWAGLTGDALLLVLSVVAVVDLSINGALAGRSDPIAIVAPALVGLGVAVVAVHVIGVAGRFAVRRTAYSSRSAGFLASRHLVRRPAMVRQARVLVIASCLACFGVTSWSVARTNRQSVATFTVGAPVVVTVAPRGETLEAAVAEADPAGRYAMAARRITTPSSSVLAVDATRLAVAVAWPAGLAAPSARATARTLDPPSGPEVTLPGGVVDLTAAVRASPGLPLDQVHLSLWVFNPVLGTTIVDLGPLRDGSGAYAASLAESCPGGCRLAGLALTPAAGSQPSGPARVVVTIRDLRAGTAAGGAAGPLHADLSAARWQTTVSGVTANGDAGALTVSASLDAIAGYAGANGSITPPMAAPADHPALVPAVVTSDVESVNGGPSSPTGIPAVGFDGNTNNVDAVITVPALPGLGSSGVMVDVDQWQGVQVNPTLTSTVSDEVWLGPAAPPDAIDRLEHAGLQVESIDRASALDSGYAREGPALADDFFLLATIAALLVAALSTISVVGASFRSRATELAALEVSGVRRRSLAGALGIESLVLGTTALLGTAAGALAATLAIRSLPELASPALIPLPDRVTAGPLLLVGGAALATVLLAASVASITLLREASPSRLLQAPNDAVI